MEIFGTLYRWQILDSFLGSIKGSLEAEGTLDIKGCDFIFHSRTDVESLVLVVCLGGLQVTGGDPALRDQQSLGALSATCTMLFHSRFSAIALHGCSMGAFLRVKGS